MMECIFKLNTPTMAILVENNQPKVIIVPANAVLTVVSGNIDGVGLLKVRHQNQTLDILATDLRSAGEAAIDDSV